MRTFASDNNAPAAAAIIDALVQANQDDAISYGHDEWTARAQARFAQIFGNDSSVFFTFNGTGANVVALSCLTKPYEAVMTPATSHVQTDECGAFERFTGCKVLPVPCAPHGKLTPADLSPFTGPTRDEHHVVPRVISVSQSTEYGTLYTPAELRELCDFAHANGWYVHVDGARIANAAAALGLGLRECTRDLGVDVLTFGGTKNGLVFGEAIVFLNPDISTDAAPFARKQAMQLASKMRFVAAQFLALLEDDRWRSYALHANAMTRRLEAALAASGLVRITRPVECNAIFAVLPPGSIERLQKQYFFYCFDEEVNEVRWMTHHATREQDVDAFAQAVIREAGALAD